MLAPGGRLRSVHLPLLTARLSLRLPELADVPRLTQYIDSPRVFRGLQARHTPFSREEEARWVRSARRSAAKGEHLHLTITLRGQRQLIGGIGLEVRDWENRRGFLGYWLAPEYWHQGYASEATRAVLHLAFRRLHLHRVEAQVFGFNLRSMRLLRRLGFRREGLRRDILYRGGQWHDEVSFGLLAREYRSLAGARH